MDINLRKEASDVRSELLSAMLVKIAAFWVVSP
jgi:hypothetical protein